jgi:flagellar biosynthetic protein FlhB
MSEEEGQEKKHDPSDKAVSEANEQGQGPRSPDAIALASLAAAVGAIVGAWDWVASPIQRLAVATIEDATQGGKLDFDAAIGLMLKVIVTVSASIAIPLSAALLAGSALSLAQTGGTLATGALEPGFHHLDPSNGYRKLFGGGQAIAELTKGVGKLLVVGGISAWFISQRAPELPPLAASDPSMIGATAAKLCFDLFVYLFPLLVIIAVGDFAWSWWTFRDRLMRTDQQVRDDAKEAEGNPEFKAVRKARARAIALGQGIARLKDADVLVTNPTHVAVALRYRKGTDLAPIVLAKGLDLVAIRLRQEADRLGVARVEDRTLARALHARVRVGRAIPADLYGPVARVLAVIWKRRRRRA